MRWHPSVDALQRGQVGGPKLLNIEAEYPQRVQVIRRTPSLRPILKFMRPDYIESRRSFKGASAPAALILALLFTAQAQAATFYVSASGSDTNSCASATDTNQAKQKATVSAGVTCASAGDTVLIHGGTYAGVQNRIDAQRFTVNSGTSWANPVTIGGYPGESVTLVPPNGYSGVGLSDSGPSPAAHYLIIQDLAINMGRGSAEGIYVYTAHHIRFQRIELYGGDSFGVHFGHNTDYIEFIDSWIHDVGSLTGDATEGHAIYCTSGHSLIARNTIDHIAGYGIHLYGNGLVGSHDYPGNNILDRNFIHDVGLHGGTAFGIVVSWGQDNVLSNNVVFRNPGGILAYTDSTRTVLVNNTAAFNTDVGIALQYYADAPTVRQNIAFGNRNAQIMDYGGTGSPLLSGNVTVDPSFKNPAQDDYEIQPWSVARDAGLCASSVKTDYAGKVRAVGARCAAGAFEAPPVTVTPSAPVNLRAVT